MESQSFDEIDPRHYAELAEGLDIKDQSCGKDHAVEDEPTKERSKKRDEVNRIPDAAETAEMAADAASKDTAPKPSQSSTENRDSSPESMETVRDISTSNRADGMIDKCLSSGVTMDSAPETVQSEVANASGEKDASKIAESSNPLILTFGTLEAPGPSSDALQTVSRDVAEDCILNNGLQTSPSGGITDSAPCSNAMGTRGSSADASEKQSCDKDSPTEHIDGAHSSLCSSDKMVATQSSIVCTNESTNVVTIGTEVANIDDLNRWASNIDVAGDSVCERTSHPSASLDTRSVRVPRFSTRPESLSPQQEGEYVIRCLYNDGKYICLSCNFEISFPTSFEYHIWKHLHAVCNACSVCKEDDIEQSNPFKIKCPNINLVMFRLNKRAKKYHKKIRRLKRLQQAADGGCAGVPRSTPGTLGEANPEDVTSEMLSVGRITKTNENTNHTDNIEDSNLESGCSLTSSPANMESVASGKETATSPETLIIDQSVSKSPSDLNGSSSLSDPVPPKGSNPSASLQQSPKYSKEYSPLSLLDIYREVLEPVTPRKSSMSSPSCKTSVVSASPSGSPCASTSPTSSPSLSNSKGKPKSLSSRLQESLTRRSSVDSLTSISPVGIDRKVLETATTYKKILPASALDSPCASTSVVKTPIIPMVLASSPKPSFRPVMTMPAYSFVMPPAPVSQGPCLPLAPQLVIGSVRTLADGVSTSELPASSSNADNAQTAQRVEETPAPPNPDRIQTPCVSKSTEEASGSDPSKMHGDHIEKLEKSNGNFYVCGVGRCTYATAMDVNFFGHISVKHSFERSLPCVYCQSMFMSKELLVEHMKRHMELDEELRTFSCYECDFSSNMPVEFRSHYKQCHADSFRHVCKHCVAMFTEFEDLIEHLLKNAIKVHHCAYCRVVNSNRRFMIKHISRQHPGEARRMTTRCMMLCQENRRLSKALTNTCTACGESTEEAKYLREHLEHCTVYAQLQKHSRATCVDCGAEFRNQLDQVKHVMRGHDCNFFICPLNECIFSTSNPLKFHAHCLEHEHIGDSVTVHDCSACEVKSNLKSYIRVHIILCHAKDRLAQMKSSEKRHQAQVKECENSSWFCNKCQVYFPRDISENRLHRKDHQDRHLKKQKSEVCTYCEKTFQDLSGLYSHVVRIHGGRLKVDMFVCTECSVRSTCKDIVLEHAKRDHRMLAPVADTIEKTILGVYCPASGCNFSCQERELDSVMMAHIDDRHADMGNALKEKVKTSLSDDLKSEALEPSSSLFQCQHDCSFRGTVREYRKHMVTHFTGERNFSWYNCGLCEFQAPTAGVVIRHSRSSHTCGTRLPTDKRTATLIGTGGIDELPDLENSDSRPVSAAESLPFDRYIFNCDHCDIEFSSEADFQKHTCPVPEYGKNGKPVIHQEVETKCALADVSAVEPVAVPSDDPLPVTPTKEEHDSGSDVDNEPAPDLETASTVSVSSTGSSKEVFCRFCTYKCKTTHGLAIHTSWKHKEMSKTAKEASKRPAYRRSDVVPENRKRLMKVLKGPASVTKQRNQKKKKKELTHLRASGPVTPSVEEHDSADDVDNDPAPDLETASTASVASTGSSNEVFCRFCTYKCKTTHGMAIHTSVKHKEMSKTAGEAPKRPAYRRSDVVPENRKRLMKVLIGPASVMKQRNQKIKELRQQRASERKKPGRPARPAALQVARKSTGGESALQKSPRSYITFEAAFSVFPRSFYELKSDGEYNCCICDNFARPNWNSVFRHIVEVHLCLNKYCCSDCDFAKYGKATVVDHCERDHKNASVVTKCYATTDRDELRRVVEKFLENPNDDMFVNKRTKFRGAPGPSPSTSKSPSLPVSDSHGAFESGLPTFQQDLSIDDKGVEEADNSNIVYQHPVITESHQSEQKHFKCVSCCLHVVGEDVAREHTKNRHKANFDAIMKQSIKVIISLVHKCRACGEYESRKDVQDVIEHYGVRHKLFKRYLCNHCKSENSYSSLKDLIEHTKVKHPTKEIEVMRSDENDTPIRYKNSFKCPHCSLSKPSEQLVQRHITSSHSPNAAFECLYCPFGSNKKQEISDHHSGLHGQSPLIIIVNNSTKRVSAVSALENSRDRPQRESTPNRTSCTTKAESSPAYARRSRSEFFTCPKCEKFSSSILKEMRVHIMHHMDYKPFRCGFHHCKVRGFKESSVAKHFRSVHTGEPCVKHDYNQKQDRVLDKILRKARSLNSGTSGSDSNATPQRPKPNISASGLVITKMEDGDVTAGSKTSYFGDSKSTVTYFCLICDYKCEYNFMFVEKHFNGKHSGKIKVLPIQKDERERYEPVIEKTDDGLNLTCRVCGFFCHAHTEYRQHWLSHLVMRWKCGYCGRYESADKQEAMYHSRVEHPGVAHNILPITGEDGTKPSGVPKQNKLPNEAVPSTAEEWVTSKNKIPFRKKSNGVSGCSKCEFSTPDLKKLEEHFIRWHKPRWRCEVCDFKCRNHDDMIAHCSQYEEMHEFVEIDEDTGRPVSNARKPGASSSRESVETMSLESSKRGKKRSVSRGHDQEKKKRRRIVSLPSDTDTGASDAESVQSSTRGGGKGPRKALLSDSDRELHVERDEEYIPPKGKKRKKCIIDSDSDSDFEEVKKCKKSVTASKSDLSWTLDDTRNDSALARSSRPVTPLYADLVTITVVESNLTYRCCYCPETLDTELELGLHLKRHIRLKVHPVSTVDNNKGVETAMRLYERMGHPFYCTKCGKSFANLSCAKGHVVASHRWSSKVHALKFRDGKPCGERETFVFEEFSQDETIIPSPALLKSNDPQLRSDFYPTPDVGLQPAVLLLDFFKLKRFRRNCILDSEFVKRTVRR